MNTQKVYSVRAVALTGQVFTHDFLSKQEAKTKIREYKDAAEGFLISEAEYDKILV
jgi:hypothetical protein